MTYATQTNLETRFGTEELKQLTDKTGTGSIVAAVVDKALADTDSEMDGYIAVQYALPIPGAVIILVLEAIASDIARYYLHENRATDEVEIRYERRIDQLKGIASGKIKLVDSVTGLVYGEQPTQVGSGPIYDGAALIFTDEYLDGY
tara:strand:+ start:983 stop:1423 length:441 start_codon:yes stop_codon:yes gene_type:complete